MSDFFIGVSLYAKEGREDELRANLIAVVEPSRKDEGNLRYELFADQNDPRRFIFLEHWASLNARKKHHAQTEHIRHFEKNGGASAVERYEYVYTLNRIA
ncbi:MAG TPA: putative quinol monooxygenase [Polaromonas sp.]|jgi:quinol monooxygenase YgiN